VGGTEVYVGKCGDSVAISDGIGSGVSVDSMKDVRDGAGDGADASISTVGVAVGVVVWQAIKIRHKKRRMTNRGMFYPFLCAVCSLDQIFPDPYLQIPSAIPYLTPKNHRCKRKFVINSSCRHKIWGKEKVPT
jgi:hypothetical protein